MDQRALILLIVVKLAITDQIILNKFVIELSRPDSGLDLVTDEYEVSLDAQGLSIVEDQ